jgi:hypothetical protein
LNKLCAVFAALAAAVAALIYFSRPRQKSASCLTGDIPDLLRQIRRDLKEQRRSIYDSRSVLNDAHRLIHTVSKGLGKQPS